jgi:hypothetical protein
VDIVLGVSMTPTTVRMVLVEGARADGLTVDHDVFDVTATEDVANSSAPDQVISAILGTQQSAQAGAHRLRAIGVTWSDHDEAARLREELVARGIDDVMLLSDLHAAGALAQAAGRAVGYDKTALMFIERDTATLSVVETNDGSIVKVLTRSLHAADAMAVMTDMVTSLQAHDVRAGGLFVVGSGVDITSIKEHLEHLVPVPVSAPEDAGMALARGAALAAAAAPRFEASTVGLAYSQDPDGATAGDVYRVNPAFVATQIRPAAVSEPVIDDEVVADESRRPFLLVGSSLSAIFVIGVVALVISLAVSIRPTADQRPNPGESIVAPSAQAPAPPVAEQVQPPPVAAPAPPPPPPETIKPPVPVVQEAPQQAPRQVFVDTAPAPAAAPAPVPVAAPAPPPAAAPDPAPLPAAPVPGIAPPNYVPPSYPDYPAYYPNRTWRGFDNRPPWVDNDPPQQQPPWQQQQPQQPPPWQQQQPQWAPPPQQQPLIPLLPVIQQPLFPQQPTLPPLPVVQDPVVPQQPSGPISRGPRGGNPFWPF